MKIFSIEMVFASGVVLIPAYQMPLLTFGQILFSQSILIKLSSPTIKLSRSEQFRY